MDPARTTRNRTVQEFGDGTAMVGLTKSAASLRVSAAMRSASVGTGGAAAKAWHEAGIAKTSAGGGPARNCVLSIIVFGASFGAVITNLTSRPVLGSTHAAASPAPPGMATL